LKQCQGKDSGQRSKTWNNVKAKIQDKEAHLRQCQSKDPRQEAVRNHNSTGFRIHEVRSEIEAQKVGLIFSGTEMEIESGHRLCE
jgi:hypothetical protein